MSPVTLSTSGNKIIISVSGSVPTTFMRLVNIDHVDVGASTTVSVGEGTVEVALALDNSGSMNNSDGTTSKISSLKTAASNLVDKLFADAQNSIETDPIKIAVVPFAASVNVGASHAGDSWMDTSAQNPYHADEMKAVGTPKAPSTTNNFTLVSNLKDFERKRDCLGRLRRGATLTLRYDGRPPEQRVDEVCADVRAG